MRVCGFDLSVPNVNNLTIPTVSYWVRDGDDGSFYVPFTLALREIDLRKAGCCRCSQCLTVAILTHALQDVGSDPECPNIDETLRLMKEWVDEDMRRVGAHERP